MALMVKYGGGGLSKVIMYFYCILFSLTQKDVLFLFFLVPSEGTMLKCVCLYNIMKNNLRGKKSALKQSKTVFVKWSTF